MKFHYKIVKSYTITRLYLTREFNHRPHQQKQQHEYMTKTNHHLYRRQYKLLASKPLVIIRSLITVVHYQFIVKQYRLFHTTTSP